MDRPVAKYATGALGANRPNMGNVTNEGSMNGARGTGSGSPDATLHGEEGALYPGQIESRQNAANAQIKAEQDALIAQKNRAAQPASQGAMRDFAPDPNELERRRLSAVLSQQQPAAVQAKPAPTANPLDGQISDLENQAYQGQSDPRMINIQLDALKRMRDQQPKY